MAVGNVLSHIDFKLCCWPLLLYNMFRKSCWLHQTFSHLSPSKWYSQLNERFSYIYTYIVSLWVTNSNSHHNFIVVYNLIHHVLKTFDVIVYTRKSILGLTDQSLWTNFLISESRWLSGCTKFKSGISYWIDWNSD